MNIVNNNKNANRLVENLNEKANKLVESYKRSTNQRQFLAENGDTVENQIIYNFLGLNECALNEDKRFTFENGMYIPGLNTGLGGRLSLKGMFEASKNEDEFVANVMEQICEQKLMFHPTEADEKALHEAYKNYTKESLNS